MAGGMMVTPRLSVAWQHAYGDLTPAAALAFAGTTGANFTVTGVPVARDGALIDAGVDWRLGTNVRLGMFYFGQLSSNLNVNAVRGRFTWAF
jgi:outer membrane autotransporter protein